LAFAITREAFGEPFVVLLVRIAQRFVRRRGRRLREAALGPSRPDRFSRKGSEAIVVSCRPKPGWDEAATIEIGDRYYRVAAVEEVSEGVWLSIAYRLREQDPTSAIRRLVPYRPPPQRRSGSEQSAKDGVPGKRDQGRKSP
jgi:hypothetical protein